MDGDGEGNTMEGNTMDLQSDSINPTAPVGSDTAETVDVQCEQDKKDPERQDEPRITFADLGIPSTVKLEQGISGKKRKFSDIPTSEKMYALAMILGIMSLLVFTIYRLTQVKNTDPDFVFCIVLIVNSAFCSFYVIDSVKRERPSEIFILSIAIVLMVIYLIVNFAAGHKTDVKLARMIIAIVIGIPLVGFGLKTGYIYYVSRSLIFRTVGANSSLQDQLQRLFFFQDFLKFDLELGISMIILILTPGLSVKLKDIIILSVGGVFTLAWFFFGYFGFKEELKISPIFFPLGLPEYAYVIYKMYDISHYIESDPGLAAATIACACFAIVIRTIVLILGFFVYRDFGNGLKEKI